MKKIISLALLAVLCTGVSFACVKKSSASNDKGLTTNDPYTIIVMDTTQALLDGVQVKIGKQTYTTSFDGRVVLKPGQWHEGAKVQLSRDGFNDKTFTLKAAKEAVIVALSPKPLRPGKDDHVREYEHSVGSPRGVVYKAMPTLGSGEDGVAADGAEGVMELSSAVTTDVFYTEIGHTSAHGSMSNNVSAGKLTAGEVNDFAKWYFWPRVLDDTHSKFIGEWNIEPRMRYTVQVMNKEGFPVVNYPVNLIDDKGNTIFQAVTDNTGKAELWGNLITTAPKVPVRVPEKTIIIDEPCEAPSDVDVVFVFDATGSMGDELRYLQAEMKDVIARAKEATGGLDIRTGAVVYRDHGDEYITRISRLTEDIKTTQAFIDKQSASGGGDYEEAIPEALMAALNSSGWNENARARIAFLILDAPCHKDSTTLALLHEQILTAAALGVRIVPVVCSGLRESGEYLLRSIALATNGTSFFLTDDSGIGHSHLKPTTDSIKVEHLNDMLVRTIVEFSTMPSCEAANDQMANDQIEENFIPNPFDIKDLENGNVTIPHGEGILYLMDISGKLITVLEGNFEDILTTNDQLLISNRLPIGVYFIKAFIGGQWYTKKVVVR